jgi:CheY-like chemotaxis protein
MCLITELPLSGSPVLLADESSEAACVFEDVLRKSHLTNPLVVVRSGTDAVAYLEGAGAYADREHYPFPGALFLDLKLPGASGLEVLQWLQARPHLGEKLLKVVITQFGDITKVARAYELGANSFLSKPITETDFDNLMQRFRPVLPESLARPAC